MPVKYIRTTGTSEKKWVWFPGWSFSGNVFDSLSETLPGEHYYYEWPATPEINTFSEAADEATRSCPDDAVLIGWSLGGALARAVERKHQIKALMTIASPPSFCRTESWPSGMPADDFSDFTESFSSNPEQTLKRFRALCANGAGSAASVIRTLAQSQLSAELSDALTRQLSWLGQYDFTDSLLTDCTHLHLFAEHDTLAPPPHIVGTGHNHLIPGTCHALFIQQPEIVRSLLIGLHESTD